MTDKDLYPTVVTFYTPTWEYEAYAVKLMKDCERLELPFYAKKLSGTGEWITNTAIKPIFIRDTLHLLKRPILWIDADGSLLKRPDYVKAPYPFDFAARRHQVVKVDRHWHVGTLYFNYTQATLDFVDLWVEANKKFVGSDEGALDLLWKTQQSELKINTDELPATYFEMFVKLEQVPLPDTVISHRASRCPDKLRNKQRRLAKEQENQK